ncbi:MAG TPA: ATP-binding protein [Candidatus Dormibacteraeota bacterium]
MTSTRDAELGEALDKLQAASLELIRLEDISEIAETALAWALDLTRSSIGFITLTGDSDDADQVYSRTSDGRRHLPSDQIDRLVRGGTGEASLVHLLQSGGRRLGMIGVTRGPVYEEIDRSSFAVLATHLGAIIEVAILAGSDPVAGLRTMLETRTRELERTISRLETVDAARQLLLKNVVAAQDKAAKRFASELHDDALQKLTAAELHLQRLKLDDEHQRAIFAEACDLILQTEESLRRLLFEVRPPALENLGGLEATVRERMMMLRSLTNAEVTTEIAVPDDIAYELKSMVFRQVSEAVTNIEKHARATQVHLSLVLSEGIVHGRIKDNGVGFVVAERNNLPGHLGLLSIRERAILAGGWYKIESEPGAGTTIEFGLPTY